MPADPRLQSQLAVVIGSFVALYTGVQIGADNQWPALIAATLIAVFIASRLFGHSIETLLLCGALLGYILGNRGFAQIMLGELPLFYAELALGAAGLAFLTRAALARELPLRIDFLNLAIFSWIIVSSGRLLGDLRIHGLAALRDFAMVYYAGFFFLAQKSASNPYSRSALLRCVTIASVLLVPLFWAEDLWSDFFVQHITLFGTPIILHKPDLVSVYAGIGLLWAFYNFQRNNAPGWIALFILSLAGIAYISTRAVFVALLVMIPATLALGHRQFCRWLASAAFAGLILLTTLAFTTPGRFTDSKLYSLYEHACSIVDFGGQHRYANEEAASSGDNNRFRAVWWRLLFDRTIQENPAFGLGWGTDLADDFIRTYNPLEADSFSVRSPHNFILTLFARSGFIGLIAFLAVVGGMARACWISRYTADLRHVGLWMGAWLVLICACFGVVLEGPMGAVVFWTLVGLAHGFPSAQDPQASHVPPSQPSVNETGTGS